MSSGRRRRSRRHGPRRALNGSGENRTVRHPRTGRLRTDRCGRSDVSRRGSSGCRRQRSGIGRRAGTGRRVGIGRRSGTGRRSERVGRR